MYMLRTNLKLGSFLSQPPPLKHPAGFKMSHPDLVLANYPIRGCYLSVKRKAF